MKTKYLDGDGILDQWGILAETILNRGKSCRMTKLAVKIKKFIWLLTKLVDDDILNIEWCSAIQNNRDGDYLKLITGKEKGVLEPWKNYFLTS